MKSLPSIDTSLSDYICSWHITTTELSSPAPHIVYVNRAFTRISRYSAGEAIGQTPRLLQGALTSRVEMARMRSALETRTAALACSTPAATQAS